MYFSDEGSTPSVSTDKKARVIYNDSRFFCVILSYMWWIDYLFPFSCVSCHSFGSYVCDNCIKKAGYVPLVCAVCRKPVAKGATHIRCKNDWSPDSSIAVWQYKGVIKKAIKVVKYHFAYQIAYILGGKLVHELLLFDFLPKKALVVPIPIARSRFNSRGFNQSEEIAEIICKRKGWQMEPDILLRSKNTSPQVKLRAFSRSQNIRGKFAINKAKKDFFVNNKLPIVLFDDVWSTGSTLFEATRVLKEAGAREVLWITCCR